MVAGLEVFKRYFGGYENQYVLIGGTACDILFEENESSFRVTKDFDIVLVVKALTAEFGSVFWKFIEDGEYENKFVSNNQPQFYRFSNPKVPGFPKMIELFGRPSHTLTESNNLTPIHIDDDISSLSAILLDKDYYDCLIAGRTIINGVSILRAEYLILFKAKAHMDLKLRKDEGERIDSKNIRKHKNDILRLTAEMYLEDIAELPISVHSDMQQFINLLKQEPFNWEMTAKYGQTPESLRRRLSKMFKAAAD